MKNPHPDHITEATWWFVEQLLALDPHDTEFAGAWGDFKPGYHNDRATLLANPAWRNDYSITLPADKLGPAWAGAAVDWTFRSAQAGDMRNIRKYCGRVRAAFLNRDARLRGWREVLGQGDADNPADGYDFQAWTERTPDDTHRWHMHFSELRANTESMDNKRAMLSVLRGETLDQWRTSKIGETTVIIIQWPKGNPLKHWASTGAERQWIRDVPALNELRAAYPGIQTVDATAMDEKTVTRLYGPEGLPWGTDRGILIAGDPVTGPQRVKISGEVLLTPTD